MYYSQALREKAPGLGVELAENETSGARIESALFVWHICITLEEPIINGPPIFGNGAVPAGYRDHLEFTIRTMRFQFLRH